MGATKESAKKTVRTIKETYGKDHYKKIGAMGGNPMLLKIREERLRKEAENKNS